VRLSLVRDPKGLRAVAVVSAVAGVHCKLPSTSPSPLLLESKKHTDASGRPSGHSSSSSHTSRAALNATPAQVQLNHQTSAAALFFSSRALFCRFRSRLLGLVRFHEAYVIPVHAWVKQWHCSDLSEWRPPHLPAAVRDGRLAASSRGAREPANGFSKARTFWTRGGAASHIARADRISPLQLPIP
jgi:hypothetical protein